MNHERVALPPKVVHMPQPDVGDRVRFVKPLPAADGTLVPFGAEGTVTHDPAYGFGVRLDKALIRAKGRRLQVVELAREYVEFIG